MIEYKYQKVKGLSEKKFLENGHTMFETDVLQRLKRLAYLEEQIKQGQLLPIDSVVGRSEQLKAEGRKEATEEIKQWLIEMDYEGLAESL